MLKDCRRRVVIIRGRETSAAAASSQNTDQRPELVGEVIGDKRRF
jgi:hypothetical protein